MGILIFAYILGNAEAILQLSNLNFYTHNTKRNHDYDKRFP
jgi:hypothetical protein